MTGLALDLPRPAPPGAGETRLLLLQVVMASGTSFAIEVARAEGSEAAADSDESGRLKP